MRLWPRENWSPYPYSGYSLNKTLGLCGIGDQAELLKITPESLGREEMAWLWTALKADYRLTFPFKVSVALLATRPDDVVRAAGTEDGLFRDCFTAPVDPVNSDGKRAASRAAGRKRYADW